MIRGVVLQSSKVVAGELYRTFFSFLVGLHGAIAYLGFPVTFSACARRPPAASAERGGSAAEAAVHWAQSSAQGGWLVRDYLSSGRPVRGFGETTLAPGLDSDSVALCAADKSV